VISYAGQASDSWIGPDPEIVQALMEMYEAVQEMTFRWDRAGQIDVMQEIITIFIEAWLKDEVAHPRAPATNFALLRELMGGPHPKVSGIAQQLDARLGKNVSETQTVPF
jgi:hypothetical protein